MDRVQKRIDRWDKGETLYKKAQVRHRIHRVDLCATDHLIVLREPPDLSGKCKNNNLIEHVLTTADFYGFDYKDLNVSDEGFWLPEIDENIHASCSWQNTKHCIYAVSFIQADAIRAYITWPVLSAMAIVSNSQGGAEMHIDLQHQVHMNGNTHRTLHDGIGYTTLNPGDVCIIPAGVPHSFQGQGQALTISLDTSHLRFS